jgi:hypothetical protein
MRNRYLFVADILAALLAAWGAFAFRFGWLFADERPEFVPFLLTAIVIKVGTFFAFGLYRRYWRYAGFSDLVATWSRACCDGPRSTPTPPVGLSAGREGNDFRRESRLVGTARQVAVTAPARLLIPRHGENSILAIAAELRPSVVFHAAAHENITLMENNATEAITPHQRPSAVVSATRY